MRNLTIKRTKSFVGCLGKLKIYIQDPASPELIINNKPCRKIGELKNGEEKIFSIDENETTVFVIADKLSKDYCNEFYNIPAGQEDIYLTGKNHFNPANGNAFRFDGVTNEEIIKNRKKGTKKGIIILCAALIGGFIIGFSITQLFNTTSNILDFINEEPKAFSTEEMQITLTNKFTETELEEFTYCYDSKYAAVFALKESISSFDNINTLEDYGNLIIEVNGLTDISTLKTYDDLLYFEYSFENSESKLTYYYFSVVYKTQDDFWLIQFATPEENSENLFESFVKWAKSVEFKNS